ncbi:MAG: hypothetical protein WB507_03650, partial [Solirubrobacterales bacterium]
AILDPERRWSTSRCSSLSVRAGVGGRIGHPSTKATYLGDTTLELGLRSQAIANELVLSKKTIDDHKAILRDSLCGEVSGGERELSVAIVSAARRARIPWIPLHYEDDANDPLSALGGRS